MFITWFAGVVLIGSFWIVRRILIVVILLLALGWLLHGCLLGCLLLCLFVSFVFCVGA